jgi:hypothetical protein
LRTYYNGKYGIKLVNDGGKYRYIWDGVRNGSASDPIALTAKADQGSGGGGGCSAGFGGLAAVIIAGFFAFRKRFA